MSLVTYYLTNFQATSVTNDQMEEVNGVGDACSILV